MAPNTPSLKAIASENPAAQVVAGPVLALVLTAAIVQTTVAASSPLEAAAVIPQAVPVVAAAAVAVAEELRPLPLRCRRRRSHWPEPQVKVLQLHPAWRG